MTEDKTRPRAERTRLWAFLRTLNWKSALGELLLIVIGVLVALEVNNWNADRQDRRAGVSILRFADYQAAQEDDRNVVFEVVRPYFLRAFRDIRFRETATPISYDEIVRDPYFQNVLDYRLRSLEVNCVDPTATAIKEVSGLLEDLDREIAFRQ